MGLYTACNLWGLAFFMQPNSPETHQAAVCIHRALFFSAESCSRVWLGLSWLNAAVPRPPSPQGYLGCFPFGAIPDQVAVNFSKQVFT